MQTSGRMNLQPDVTLLARLFCQCAVDGETGCWVWTRGIGSHGYGMAKFEGNMKLVHRLTWVAAGLEIPVGFQIDHLCRNPRCCNPDHLEAVTGRENLARGDSPIMRRTKQTHCIHGHLFDAANTLRHPTRGTRLCRECKKVIDKKYKQRKAAGLV